MKKIKKIYVVGGANYYAQRIENHELTDDLSTADIVMFTGGEDVDPSMYGCKKHRTTYSNINRDMYEKEIFEKINSSNKTEIESKVFTDYEDQFQWFIGAAVILLIIEILISSGKKDWETKFKFFEPKDENEE